MTDDTENPNENPNENKAEEATAEVGTPTTSTVDADPLAQALEEAKRLKDALMRTAADFDNFRKRSRREIDEARKNGREELLKELLPVFDNLARAVDSAQRASDIKSMADGVAMVLRHFTDTLARNGITRIPTVGQSFDPQMHEAIQQLETDEHPPGVVIAEVQAGYMQDNRLIRAALVVVSKPKSIEDGETAS